MLLGNEQTKECSSSSSVFSYLQCHPFLTAHALSNLPQHQLWSSRLPLLGSLLHVPHVPGLLTNAAQWFIQRYGKMVTPHPPYQKKNLRLIWVLFRYYRLGFTLARILRSYSTTMRMQEICSTKTLSQASETFINPQSLNDQFQDVLTVLFTDSGCLETN